MLVFPNCKINLGLRILEKRSDGYHNLETIFYPLPINDILEIIEYRDASPSKSIPFTTSGLKIQGELSHNLCLKAYGLLKIDFPQLPHIKMHLHKTIPAGSGLGAGSADAAFTLKLLNEKFDLGLKNDQLISYAVQLGSDCPFFLLNKPCYATGRGEILEPIDIDLSPYKLLVIYPGIHINTGQAFLQVNIAKTERSVKKIIREPIETWKVNLINDFDQPAFKQYPVIAEIKEKLYAAGALYASMSGSGSTVYGIFPKEMTNNPQFPKEYFVKEVLL